MFCTEAASLRTSASTAVDTASSGASSTSTRDCSGLITWISRGAPVDTNVRSTSASKSGSAIGSACRSLNLFPPTA